MTWLVFVYYCQIKPQCIAGLMLQAGHTHMSERSIPHYTNCRIQRYRSVSAALEVQPEELEDGWTRIGLRRRTFRPVRLLNDAMQRELSQVLKERVSSPQCQELELML